MRALQTALRRKVGIHHNEAEVHRVVADSLEQKALP